MMKSLFGSITAATLLSLGMLATAQAQEGTIEAPQPRSEASPFRLTPVIGSSSFTTADEVDTDEFGDTLSAGVLADFGRGGLTFQTGVLTLQTEASSSDGGNASVDIDTWGVPLLLRVNFSGKPHETVFLKAGAMPFTT
ncbi:MAG: hypothetical protein V4692_06670, partial [Bdellovibrionota bacterium]